jgi:hypothetical protein
MGSPENGMRGGSDGCDAITRSGKQAGGAFISHGFQSLAMWDGHEHRFRTITDVARRLERISSKVAGNYVR